MKDRVLAKAFAFGLPVALACGATFFVLGSSPTPPPGLASTRAALPSITALEPRATPASRVGPETARRSGQPRAVAPARPAAGRADTAPASSTALASDFAATTSTSVGVALDGLVKAVEDPERTRFDEALAALREALAHGSAEDAAALVAFFKKATDSTLLQAIAEALEPHGLARPEVRSALAAIAEQDELVDRRTAAIAALGFAKPDEATLGQLDRLARSDRDVEVRTAAANALGAAAERDAERSPTIARLLIAVAANDEDEGVRSAALWSVRGRDADATSVAQVARVLASDKDVGPRQAAADVLADVAPEHRAAALAALSGSLASERDEDVRQTVLTSIVRAGRTDAIPVLEAIKGAHPDLAQDADDYLAVLKTGETDMEVLHELKQQREDSRRPSEPDTDEPE